MNYGAGTSKDDWVCPNDRQLRLRAKLQTGWSVKAGQLKRSNKQEPLDATEQEIIQEVIKRAEALDHIEEERVGRLVERVDNMKRNVMGAAPHACTLCGDRFGLIFEKLGLFGAKCFVCHDCKNSVCQKCGIENLSATKKENIWLCRICAETREMWKKSNAWFFKGLPKYTIPKKSQPEKLAFNRRPIENMKPPTWSLNIATNKASEDNSSSDEEDLARLVRSKALVTSSVSSQESKSSRSTEDSEEKDEEEEEEQDLETDAEKSPSLKSIDIFTAISEFTSIANASDTEQPIVIPIRKVASGGSVKDEPLAAIPISPSDDSVKIQPSALVSSKKYLPPTSPITARHVSPLSSGPVCNGDFSGSLKRGGVLLEKDDFLPQPLDTSLGSVELTVTYDSTTNSLYVALHRAKGLKAMDIHGTSDPFCKLNLVPLTKTSHRLRTKTCLRTVNPEFNEQLTFYSVSETDLSLQSLHILILDDDKYGHDFLGEARFPLNRLRPHISRDLCLNLCKHYPVPREEEVWGEEDCWQHGKIFLTLCFSTKKRALVINLIKCTNLIPMDSNGFSDPFIKLYLKPDLHKRKYKTSVKWKSLNPIFNEEFTIETKITELSKQTLVITVWDKDYGKSNDFLGCLELCCNSKGDRLRQWVDMMKYPDHKHEGVHNLSDKPLSS